MIKSKLVVTYPRSKISRSYYNHSFSEILSSVEKDFQVKWEADYLSVSFDSKEKELLCYEIEASVENVSLWETEIW